MKATDIWRPALATSDAAFKKSHIVTFQGRLRNARTQTKHGQFTVFAGFLVLEKVGCGDSIWSLFNPEATHSFEVTKRHLWRLFWPHI